MPSKKASFSSALGDAVREMHSPLYVAMRENFDAMQTAFAGRRPNWPVLVKRFAAMGIKDGDGKPPTLRGAQATWYRVKREMAAAKRGPG